MLIRFGFFLVALSTAGLSLAQTTVNVQLPSTGDFAVFGSHGDPIAAPDSPLASKGGAVSATLKAGEDTVNVWDHQTGHLASTLAAKLKGSWKPSPSDFGAFEEVDVQVQQGAKPVSAAEVGIQDGRTRSPVILNPTANGAAAFFGVKPGRLLVTVKYPGTGGKTEQVTQLFPIDLQQSPAKPTMQVALAGDAAAVPPAAAPAAGPSPSAPAQDTGPRVGAPAAPTEKKSNPIADVLAYLIAIGVAVGVGYAIFRYFKANPGTVAEKLEQMGVHVPKPGDQGASSVIPIGADPVPRTQPVQRIVLDGAAVDPIPSSAPSSVQRGISLGGQVGQPSLMADGGVMLPLPEGETIVGRDAGLGLSLTGETTVSRKHATLRRNGGEVTLEDNGSTNGTYVNGARLQAGTTLRPGDEVQFGSCRFRYVA